MDVAVLSKRGQRQPRPAARPSILGDGLLERARAISLALLGLTAALGLTLVALVLNQGWPLVAGGPIPPLPPRHQGLGDATVVAVASAGDSRSQSTKRGGRPGSGGGSGGRIDSGGGASPAAPAPAGSAELVVSPTAPVAPENGRSHGDPDDHSPAPTVEQPQQTSATPAEPPPTPPASTPPPVPAEPAPPVVATTDPPDDDSYVPSWSHGKGHAYGRSSYDADEYDDHGWDDDGDSHGHCDD